MSDERAHLINRRRPARKLVLALVAAVGIGGAVVVGAAPAAASSQQLMGRGDRILPGHSVSSGMFPGGNHALDFYFKLEFETNGDLREYKVLPYQDSSSMIWHTDTGKLDTDSSSYVWINDDNGNMVLHGRLGTWQTATDGLAVTQLIVHDGGDMRMVQGDGSPEWSSRWGLSACNSGVAITEGKVSTLLSSACRLLGTPYCFGGGGLSGRSACGIDCSGLTMHAVYDGVYDRFAERYIALTHSAHIQFGTDVGTWGGDKTVYSGGSMSYLQPGDLLFFQGAFDPDRPAPRHVGIYLGANKLIDAYTDGVPVRVTTFSTSYSSGFMGSVRYW